MLGIRGTDEIRFATSCRGSGKIFTRLVVDRERVCRLEARSTTERGDEMPAKVVETDEFGYVLEVAVLMCSQHVEVVAFDADGDVVARGTTVVRPKAAKAVSIVNDAVRHDEVELLRALVALERRQGVTFKPERLIHVWYADADPERLLHFTLTVRCGEVASVSGEVLLSVVSVDGVPVDPENVRVIADEFRRFPEVPSAQERRLTVSARVTPAMGSVVVWARFRDGHEDAFFVVMPNEMRDLSITGDSEELPVEAVGPYEDWMLSQRVDASGLARQREAQASFEIRPLFSVIMPLYHTPVDFLEEAVDSMLCQSYPRVELILVNSTPDDVALKRRVDEYARADGRVKVVELERNLGITENTNAGIAYATGDFVSFMDHDDIAERDLFFCYVRGINDHPDTDLLYCDEDLFVEGHYKNAFLKPDWSEFFEETNNYACHLLTVRRSLLEQVPRPTADLDGAQDHSLTLAIAEHARNVFHARKVLYHWRSHPLSTAQNPEQKPESLDAGQTAIERHLARRGLNATVSARTDWLHVFDVRLSLETPPTARVVLWGDGTCDLALVQELGRVVTPEIVDVRRGPDQTWSEAVGAALADIGSDAAPHACDLVIVLSRDARLAGPDTSGLAQVVAYAMRPESGVVGPRLLYADGSIASLGVAVSGEGGIMHMGRFLPKETAYGRGIAELAHGCTAVEDACVVLRAETLAAAGGWDASLAMDTATIDLCARVRKLRLAVAVISSSELVVPCAPTSVVGLSRPSERRRRLELAELCRRYPAFAGDDPYYHAGLSLDGKFGFEGGWVWLIPMGPVESLRFKLSY